MAKYKYVDGVKYRVVPQSVLGYALVREDSDNSLPAGGTEGQVLGKASDADYDVEWMTVEGGGGDSVFIIHATLTDGTVTVEESMSDIIQAIDDGALLVLCLERTDPMGEIFHTYIHYCSIADVPGYDDAIYIQFDFTESSFNGVNRATFREFQIYTDYYEGVYEWCYDSQIYTVDASEPIG